MTKKAEAKRTTEWSVERRAFMIRMPLYMSEKIIERARTRGTSVNSVMIDALLEVFPVPTGKKNN
jgi:hypothetical protein